MPLRRNILANYLGMGAVVLAPILALPWYLSELGPKQFGLIGFIAMLQAILGLLDAGMSQALVREVAVRFDLTDKGRHRTASLLFGFERIYWMFALCAGCVTALLAEIIATHWLNLDGLPLESGRVAIYGAAAIFAVQFPGSIYRSLLVGTQAQIALNGIMSGSAIFRHVGGVAMVVIWPTLSTYLIWHATIALLETLIRGRWAWRLLEVNRSQVRWDSNELCPLWRLVAGMSGATLLGALTVQMDRIVLSRMVSIEQFGYYTIAATVAVGSLQLINPLTQAVLPRAIQIRGDPVALRSLSIKLARLIALLVGLGALIFITIGKWLLNVWLRNPEVVTAIYPMLALLFVGTALNAFYNVGYVNWLSQQKTRNVLQVNTFALVLSVVLIPPLVSWQGTIGAAFGWVTINLIGFVLSLGWLKRKLHERSS
ncbi:MAG: oligosaccharide flippase family protein [Rugosibacter sp.]|nr:oligosaccharide flippase family protein [Rugosibacter sp.]